jgi:hypothetical protein
MADTLKDKLSKAVKPAVDAATKYVGQAKALFAPIDKGTVQTLQDKSAQVNQFKAPQPQAKPNSFKKGGKVKRSGVAKVHKGERVLTTKQTKAFDKKGGLSKLYGAK